MFKPFHENNQLSEVRLVRNSSILTPISRRERSPQAIGVCIRLAAGWQIPILFAETPLETAQLIIRIARQEFLASAGPIASRPRSRRFTEQTLPTRMLMQAPSLGYIKAKALLEHFGSLREVLNATEDELLSVSGIGPTRAKAIRRIDRAKTRSVPDRSTTPLRKET